MNRSKWLRNWVIILLINTALRCRIILIKIYVINHTLVWHHVFIMIFLYFTCLFYPSLSFIFKFLSNSRETLYYSIKISLSQYWNYTESLCLHKTYSFCLQKDCDFSKESSFSQCIQYSLFVSRNYKNSSFNNKVHFFSNVVLVHDIVSRQENNIFQSACEFSYQIFTLELTEHRWKQITRTMINYFLE